MTSLPSSPLLASRLRRLVGAAGFVCAATVLAVPAHADARSPKARAKTTHGAVKQGTPTAVGGHKPTARERAKARSIAAASRTRAADHRTVARRPSATERATSLAAAAKAERLRDSVVKVARAQIGIPYVLGGNTPVDGFDCSGLVKYVMAALHVSLPRTAAEQAAVGKRVARDPGSLRPGDLVTFASRGEGVSHIGIYVGNGRMVHASTAAGQVIEVPLVRAPSAQIKPWRGVRRVVAVASDGGSSGRQ